MSGSANLYRFDGLASGPQFGGNVALALENQRLRDELAARDIELCESRARLISAADGERQRIERNLHDGAQQQLVLIALKLRMLGSSIAGDPAQAALLVDEAIDDLMQASGELRGLAVDVYPPALVERGLSAALEVLAERAPLPVYVSSIIARRLPPELESTIYFFVAEALTNVAKHAHASHVGVSVCLHDDTIVAEVRDDGVGGADPSTGTGLRGLGDRIGAHNGRVDAVSVVGGGTLVRAVLRVDCLNSDLNVLVEDGARTGTADHRARVSRTTNQ